MFTEKFKLVRLSFLSLAPYIDDATAWKERPPPSSPPSSPPPPPLHTHTRLFSFRFLTLVCGRRLKKPGSEMNGRREYRVYHEDPRPPHSPVPPAPTHPPPPPPLSLSLSLSLSLRYVILDRVYICHIYSHATLISNGEQQSRHEKHSGDSDRFSVK